jgi:hypothetical protein
MTFAKRKRQQAVALWGGTVHCQRLPLRRQFWRRHEGHNLLPVVRWRADLALPVAGVAKIGNYLSNLLAKHGFFVMLHHSESRISVTIDLSSDEATDLAAFLARATPSALAPLIGFGGTPAVCISARIAVTLGRLAEALARAGYPPVRAA